MHSQHLPHLPASFWEQSPQLTAIRQAAFARITSPDAVLACVLCRVAASFPPTFTLPNKTSLNYIVALVGDSGHGKSVAFRTARQLLPDIGLTVAELNIGSGQGIASTYSSPTTDENITSQPVTSALFCVPEGEQLLKLGKASESITLSTIRSAWSGETLGTANASKERRRHVPADSYRFAMAVGFQPSFAAELLTGVNAGDPQRFLFSGVTSPNQPDIVPTFPKQFAPLWEQTLTGEASLNVHSEITREIETYRIKKQRLEVPVDPLDSHRHLLQLKTAGLFALLHNDDVTLQWWNAAALMVDVSRGVRDRLAELAVLDRRQRNAERTAEQIESETVKESSRELRSLESMIRSMVQKCRVERVPVSRTDLHNATASKHRAVVDFDSALATAIERGQLFSAPDKPKHYYTPIGTRN